MGTLLFLLLLFFVIIPIGRVAWAMWRQYRMVKRQFRQAREMQDAFRRAARGERGADPGRPEPHKKKIDPEVGEYVAFEEVATFRETDEQPSGTPITPGQQIEDADWEEIR